LPLKLIASRNSKTQNLYIRGKYLGIAVDKSCGTNKRSVALAILKRIEKEIELGEYQRPAAPAGPTFLGAALAYMEAGRRKRYVAALIKYFGETPLSEIDQEAIDRAAATIAPNASPATRTAYVYTPVSAILHHAGIKMLIRRPKGFQGRTITDWLSLEDAAGIVAAAEKFDPEFSTLLTYLLYTGARIGAALDLRREDIQLDRREAWARNQKGQPHMQLRLHPDLCTRLARLLQAHDRYRMFRWHYGAQLIYLLMRAKLGHLDIDCPQRRPVGWREPPNRLDWVTFHSFRHTWATWMRHAGTDIQGLVATGNWRSARAAQRYAHAAPRHEWQRVDQLPSVGMGKGNERADLQTRNDTISASGENPGTLTKMRHPAPLAAPD
jgi:integrase